MPLLLSKDFRRRFGQTSRWSGTLFGRTSPGSLRTPGARSFAQDAEFRAEFNKLVPKARRLRNPKERPNPSDYEVVYGIVSRSAKAIDQALPFFSRLNLRTAAKQLEGFGFRVSLVKIPIEAS